MSDNPPWDTSANIINDAAVEAGLAAVADPYASTDSNFVQLCALLKSLGRDLWRLNQWTHLQKIYTFTTVTNTPTYELPADFGYMINQTGWNRTSSLPLGGPLSPQEWEYLKATSVGVVFTVLFRPRNRTIYLYPDVNTPGGYTIAYEYMSRYWVQPTGQSSGTADKPSASTDTILYDPQLVTRGLKLAFLKAKGFDSTAAQNDFDMTLQLIKGDDSAARNLSLHGGAKNGSLLSDQNIPITGFGS